jgi:hypothetical protein
VLNNSEVEPQIAVNPANTDQAVAVWQQDRFRSVGGARALVFSVTANASDNDSDGAEWSTPAPIPGFDATVSGAAFARYTDPWVSISPNGTVYASAIALTPSSTSPSFPSHTGVLVIKGSITISGGVPSITWDPAGPTTLIDTQAEPGTNPIELANDKGAVTADPTNSNFAYVVWDQIDHPGDEQNFNAFHSSGFREDALFSRTTNGGATWSTPVDLTNFQKSVSALGNLIVVQPDGTVIDVFPALGGSNKQAPQAAQNNVAVVRSPDKGVTWSDVITGPAIEQLPVSDPDTGAAVRVGETLISVAVDPNPRSDAHPNGGNIYAVWTDGRFSGFTHDDIALSVSKDGGLTWSDPIKVNQTPTNIPAGNQQAFLPTVAVNSDGTVAVTYYDFRNNTDLTPGSGLPTDYFIVVNPDPVTNPSKWSEVKLTDKSFNMENAAPTSRGVFLGDYQGLAAAGKNFYALFAQAGADSTDPSNIWFRDPPPAAEPLAAAPGPVLLPALETTFPEPTRSSGGMLANSALPDQTLWGLPLAFLIGSTDNAAPSSASSVPFRQRADALFEASLSSVPDSDSAANAGGALDFAGRSNPAAHTSAGLGDDPFEVPLANESILDLEN